MSEITLPEYHQRIERLIEDSHLSQATAHCRHILEEFPRHIPTYRLLGKAYLEQQKHALAAEMFQRVLSAQPDDLVAHVGLGLTHKESELLDPAIWHMERAYELDPYNAAIQEELRRLYMARDGHAPDQLTLTTGALARLHARCELFPQAISAARGLLAADPSRVDIKLLLAEALWRDDQRIDAVAVCREILDQLPSCITAHAIMAEVWLLSGQSDAARRHLDYVTPLVLPAKNDLDPESPVGVAFNTRGAPPLPKAVRLVPLEAESPAVVGKSLEESPDWVAALADSEDAADASPETWGADVPDIDWFRNADTNLPPADTGELPDWLQQISAEVGSEIFTISEEIVAEAAEENVEPEEAAEASGSDFMATVDAATSDLDWLTGDKEIPEITDLGDFDDWLEDTLADHGSAVTEGPVARQAPIEPDMDLLDNLPDWLSDTGAPPDPEKSATDFLQELVPDLGESLESTEESGAVESEPREDEWITGEMPAWMDEPEAEADLQLAITDWLSEIRPDSWEPDETAVEPDDGDEVISIMPGVAAGEFPDWLRDRDKIAPPSLEEPGLESESDGEEPETAWISGELVEAANDAAFLMESTSPAHDVVANTASREVEVESEARNAQHDPADAGAVAPTTEGDRMPSPGDPEEMPLEPSEEHPDDLPQDTADSAIGSRPAIPPEDEEMDIPDWLQLDVEEDLARADLPDWLQPPTSEPGEDDSLPDWLNTPTRIESESQESDSQDAPWPGEIEAQDQELSWLDQLAAGKGEAVEELPTLQWSEVIEGEDSGTAEEVVAHTAQPGTDEDDLVDEMPEDPVEAMAWLERLAARQGAPLEELPTLSADRELFDIAAQTAGPDLPDLTDESDGDEIPEDPEEAMAWLERLAARQGAPVEELPSLTEAPDEGEMGLTEELAVAMANDQRFSLDEPDEPDMLAAELPEDPEAAMAWLEQLAARQGASLEELPTLTEAPAESEKGLTDDLASTSIGEVRLPAADEFEAMELAPEIPEDPEEAMAWLEQLAARQGAPLEELPSLSIEEIPEAAEDLGIATPDEALAAMPEDPDAALAWLRGLTQEELPADVSSEPAGEGFGKGDFDLEVQDSEEVDVRAVTGELDSALRLTGEISSDVPQTSEEALAWLVAWAQLDDEVDSNAEERLIEALATGVEPDSGIADATRPATERDAAQDWEWLTESVAEEPADEGELDTWTDLAADEGPDLTLAVDLVGEVDDAMPAWLAPDAVSDTSWLDELPGEEPEAWQLDEAEDLAALGGPDIAESVLETLAAEEPAAEEPAAEEPAAEVPVAEEPVAEEPVAEEAAAEEPAAEVPAAEVPEITHVRPAVAPALEEARTALSSGDHEAAITLYGALIEAGTDVPAVIADLAEAIAANERQPLLQRLLGDAYAQQGDLQKAIDLYRQAMDQL